MSSQTFLSKRETTVTLLIYFASYPILYLVNIMLTRALGPSDFGDYSVTASVATLLAMAALLGLDQASLEFLPVYRKQGLSSIGKGLIIFALGVIIGIGVVIGGSGAAIVDRVQNHMQYQENPVILSMLWIVPMSVGIYFMYLMASHQRTMLGALLERVVLPITTALLVGFVLFIGRTLTDWTAVGLMILARVFLVIILVFILWSIWQREYQQAVPTYMPRQWFVAGLPFLLTTMVLSVQTQIGTLILEQFHPSEDEVGIYASVQQVAYLQILALTALSVLALPRLSVLLNENETEEFHKQLAYYLRILAAFGIGTLLAFTIGGNFLLGLFGSDFQTGQLPLAIVAAGNSIVLVGGLIVPILLIKELRTIVYWTMLVLFGLCLLLTYLLAPRYGALGATIGHSLSIAIVYPVQLFLLQRKTGIPYLKSIFVYGHVDG